MCYNPGETELLLKMNDGLQHLFLRNCGVSPYVMFVPGFLCIQQIGFGFVMSLVSAYPHHIHTRDNLCTRREQTGSEGGGSEARETC